MLVRHTGEGLFKASFYLGERGRVCSFNLFNIHKTPAPAAVLKTRPVRLTRFKDGSTLSTAVLNLDHDHSDSGRPVVFETMLFDENGEVHEQNMTLRYHGKHEAKRGHRKMANAIAYTLGKYGKRIV